MGSSIPSLDNSLAFAFIEFVSSSPEKLRNLFITMGFSYAGASADAKKHLFCQNTIYFVVNTDPQKNAASYQETHEQGASAMGLYVEDPDLTFLASIDAGSEPANAPDYPFPAIKGIGGGIIYLVNRQSFGKMLAKTFNLTMPKTFSSKIGLQQIDHLTHNVEQGALDHWESYYSTIFNFRRIKTFDINGEKTGLRSVALESQNGRVKIPINESKDSASQIAEFLKINNGEGIQHIALTTNDIYQTVDRLRLNGVEFQESPDTYFELINSRIPEHGEKIKDLHRLGILLDSEPDKPEHKLLQIFTKENIGPLFFEIIQRKGNTGFGEGNFQALFESIELDQMRRGVI